MLKTTLINMGRLQKIIHIIVITKDNISNKNKKIFALVVP